MADMTRQEALATLHQVYIAYVDQLIQSAEAFHTSEPLRLRAVQALFLLTDAIHGPRKHGESYALCDTCHLRRARHAVSYWNYCDTCRPEAAAIPVMHPCNAALEVSAVGEQHA